MYKGISSFFIIVLFIALTGAGYWGYQENQEKNSILIKAENQYQRAFHDLNYHINQLHDELGKTLALNSRKQLSSSLANVWRLSYIAHSDVGQLPLVLIPFNKTEEFLSNIGDFSYRIAIRDLSKNPLSNQEYNTLKTLYKDSKEIQTELRNVQTKVIENHLRWMDVELALAQEDKNMDNTIIDGFKTVDKKVAEFPEVDWGIGSNTLHKASKEKGSEIKGNIISSEVAKKHALSFLHLTSAQNIKVTETGKGLNYKAYSVMIEKNKNKIYLDITKAGGHVVWMLINREVPEENLSPDQAVEKAAVFLKNHQYLAMEETSISKNDHSLIISFAYKQDGVIVYPDTVNVKVALDKGEIIGFQSIDYIINHKKRNIPVSIISEAEAKGKVNPELNIQSMKKAIIENFDGLEVLTYEITGVLDKNIYKIYINAENGDEEEIKKITQAG